MRRLSLLLMMFVTICCAARADIVIFKKGTKLKCKVVGQTPKGLLVYVDGEETKKLVIDPSTIERIDYDYDSRLEQILQREKDGGKPLFREHYVLGAWCEEQGQFDADLYEKAIERYLHAAGNEGVPDDAYLRLAHRYEKLPKPDLPSAFKMYKKYLESKPDSLEALSAVKRIEKEINPKADSKQIADNKAEAAKDEGLEQGAWRWQPDWRSWSNEGEASSQFDSVNKTGILHLKFKEGTKGKTAFALDYHKNLTTKSSLKMNVYNHDETGIKIAIVLITGRNFEWFESSALIAPGKEWKVGMEFPLKKKFWKCEANNWLANSTTPKNLDNTTRLYILVYNARRSGEVSIDEIKFVD